MPVVTDGFAVVPAPRARPPITGLIPTLSDPRLVDDYLLDDSDNYRDEGIEQRWESGFKYAPENQCAIGGLTDECNPETMVIPANEANIAAKPGYVWAADKCSAFGWKARDFQGRARRLLETTESLQVARELWTGAKARQFGWPNNYFTGLPVDVLTNGPKTPLEALELLEGALGTCGHGQQCMIHCTRLAVIAMAAAATSAFRREGNLLLTLNDTIVVADAGYDGSGPISHGYAPAVSGSQWVYASNMVTVRRSETYLTPDSLAQAMIKSTNSIQYFAYRYAAATFNPCCLFAAEVNLPMPLIGGVS